jgi:hypothetical protein
MDMEVIPRPDVRESEIKYDNQYATTYTHKGNFTLDRIKKEIKSFHDEARKAGVTGYYTVNALFSAKDGKPARWFTITRMTDLRDNRIEWSLQEYDSDYTEGKEDEDKIIAFQVVYFSGNKEPQGGCGAHNDCFYDCLIRFAPTITQHAFPNPTILKKYCKLARDDKIPVNCIKKIEDKLPNCKIVVSGDYEYNSAKKGNYVINIVLINEHYKPGKVTNIYRVRGVPNEEKSPIIYKHHNAEKVVMYDGKEKIFRKNLNFYKMKYDSVFQNDYIFIKSETSDLKNDYEEFIKKADFLKEVTHGHYNLYKTGNLIKASLYRFYTLNRGLDVEDIGTMEANWILNSMKAALIWCKKGFEGPVHEYDINSAYPYIYSHNLFTFPVVSGEFHHFTNEEFQNLKYIKYGIYRCKITGTDPRLFRENPDCYYTHFDLNRAKELGYSIKLIEDENSPNALIYNNRVNGRHVFGTYVTELQNLIAEYPKQKPLFKKLLNVIWGALCKQNKKVTYLDANVEYEIKDDILISLKPSNYNENHFIAKTLNYDNIFNTPFARIGPFILSKMRYIMSKLVEPHLKYIVRIHTDGFFSTRELTFEKTSNTMDSLEIGTEMGNIKHIYREYIKILNTFRIIKE